MNKTLSLSAVVLLLSCAWTIKQEHAIRKAEWLAGTWKNKTTRGDIYEKWTKVKDDKYLGKSYMLKEKDTIVFETIQLIQEKNSLFYVPTVKNQNNNQPIRFALKTISDKEMAFENPAHDFPQTITYTKITKDSLVAEISGMKNGQLRRIFFPMKRID